MAAAGQPGRRVELVDAQGEQRHEDGDERRSVEEEAPRRADRLDQQGGQRRPEHASPCHHRGVQRGGVGDVLRFDQLDDEPPASRVVERVEHAENEGEDPDDPDARHAGEVEHPQHDRLGRQAGLGDDGEDALVALVGHRAGPRSEQQHRQELQGNGDPEVGRPSGEAIHQQRHRGELQPGADVGDEQSGEEHPRVPMAHAAERGRPAPRARSCAICSFRLIPSDGFAAGFSHRA
jgi:hypothetical protein